MIDQWYYGRGTDITGPVTGRELSALAVSGEIIVTDTIWQEGNENGVKASRVRHLFPVASAVIDIVTPVAVAISTVEPAIVAVAVPVAPVVDPTVAPPLEAFSPVQRQVPKNARATAGKGVVIVGQDGKTVKYKMKCSVCGYEDSSWKSIQIPRGVHRTTFYCTKCRKKRDGEIHGMW